MLFHLQGCTCSTDEPPLPCISVERPLRKWTGPSFLVSLLRTSVNPSSLGESPPGGSLAMGVSPWRPCRNGLGLR